MARYRAAVIGVGGMGECHLSSLKAMPEVDLVAICDLDEERLARRAEAFGVGGRYRDYHEMLERERPDVLGIATQVRHHREPVLAAAAARVPGVLCEKPMALDLADADAMVEACRRSGTRLAINHQGHCRPSTRRAQAMIANGDIGEPILIRGLHKGGRKAGNEIMEMGTHIADRMLCFGGEPTWCFAHFTWEGRDAEARDIMEAREMNPRDRDAGLVLGHRAFALFGFTQFPAGEMHFHAYERANNQHSGVDLLGSRGQIALRGHRAGAQIYYLPTPIAFPAGGQDAWEAIDLPEETIADGSSDPSVSTMYRELIRAIEEGREHPSSGAVGRATMEMIMGMYESHRHGAKVRLPLTERAHPLQRWREG
jgi:UDP-N-acetyl-2-amino-2-deoxyglucuronate dehydrogenase